MSLFRRPEAAKDWADTLFRLHLMGWGGGGGQAEKGANRVSRESRNKGKANSIKVSR